MSNSKSVVNHIKKRKRDLVRLFGGKCCICGFDKYPEALEFHHINPEEKEFGLMEKGATTKALEKQLKELKKCIMVCSNCHKGIHAGRIELPTEVPGYDEEIAEELLRENYRIKHGQQFYCPRCGAPVSTKGVHCIPCSNLLSRKVDRPSREELKELIRNVAFTKIAEKFGVSDNAVRKWCKTYNLPSKKKEISNYSDEDWEKI